MQKKILLVDDDQYIRELYQEILTDEGYSVAIAINGEEGLKKIHLGGYDLILLDVMMPKLDGLQILEHITKNPPQMPIGPIILLTNLSQDPILKDERTKIVTAYLVKAELTPDQLVAQVKKFLDET